MLAFYRREGQTIVVTTPSGERVTFVVGKTTGDRVQIATEAPAAFTIHRGEIQAEIDAGNRGGAAA